MTENNSGIWCVGELRGGKLHPSAYELLSAAQSLSQAGGGAVTLVVLGAPGTAQALGEAVDRGAQRILVLENPAFSRFLDDSFSSAIAEAVRKEKPRAVLLSASVTGRSLGPRLAVELKAGLAPDVTEVSLDTAGNLLGVRSAYAGNVVAQVAVKSPVAVATIRPLAFPQSPGGGKKAEISTAQASASGKTEFVRFSPEASNEIDVGAAEKIVSGGRGLGDAQGFQLILKLAAKLGAAVGASRAAVDSGWIPYKHQVGLTGRSVRPRLYIACGISGQIQHLAGMKSSDVIVAINTDPDCPMMKLSTYAVQGDYKKIVEALLKELGG